MKRTLFIFTFVMAIVCWEIIPATALEAGDFAYFAPSEADSMVTIYNQPPPDNSYIIGEIYGGSPSTVFWVADEWTWLKIANFDGTTLTCAVESMYLSADADNVQFQNPFACVKDTVSLSFPLEADETVTYGNCVTGTIVLVIGHFDDQALIMIGSLFGFVPVESIEMTGETAAQKDNYVPPVTGKAVVPIDDPEIESTLLHLLPDYTSLAHMDIRPGVELSVIADMGEWVQVFTNGTIGFVLASHVRILE